MISRIERHLLSRTASVREGLNRLEDLGADAVVFLVDTERKLLSSLTDGDIRRGLIRGLSLDDPLERFARTQPKVFERVSYTIAEMQRYRSLNYGIIPVIDAHGRVTDIVNFNRQRSYLPLDAVIMAGGKGMRLRPLTERTPKPLLRVGDKPIIEHNIDRLANFGIRQLTISLNYLGDQIMAYFRDGSAHGIAIDYVMEELPRGTIGSVGDMSFTSDYVLVMNSDLLTTIDLEQMFQTLLEQRADMVVATVPYEVKVPYGVVETSDELVTDLREKPTYTYYSNAGIYIIRREHLQRIPQEEVYDATELMRELYTNGLRVVHFPIVGYWLDIGKPADYERAQRDIKQLRL